MEQTDIKLKDLPIRSSIVKKHKVVSTFLWIITYIFFLPVVVLQIINENLEFIINKFAVVRNKIVYTIFKMIYKKEIIAKEKELDELFNKEKI